MALKILGTFGKGVDGAVSINFAESGGQNCDTMCRLHPDSENPDRIEGKSPCYADRLERTYSSYRAKLGQHAALPAWRVCAMALVELQQRERLGQAIPWVRVSVSGSVPMPDDVRQDKLFRAQFRALVAWCAGREIPFHLPCETYAKARFYRSLVGDLITVRESAQGTDRFLRATGQVSTVAGYQGQPIVERVELARSVARERRERTGRKTIVCPAVLANFQHKYQGRAKNDRAKCGNCVACVRSDVDIVYPLH